jgi:hypothetical protein
MTNKDALIAELPFSVADNMLEKAMIDEAVTAGTAYQASAADGIDKCVVRILQRLLSEPDVSEGGFSQNFDRKAAEARLLYLARKHNLKEIVSSLTPSITSKSIW